MADESEMKLDDEGWSLNEMKELIVQALSHKSSLTGKKFKPSCFEKMDMTDINIKGRSEGSCKQALKKMMDYVYKSITIREVCERAKTILDKKKVPMDMVPEAPQRPKTAYALFFQHKYKSLAKKNPGSTFKEMVTIASDTWKGMDAAKKERYYQEYQEQKVKFVEVQASYRNEKIPSTSSTSSKQANKEVEKSLDGKLTVGPSDLFWKETTFKNKVDTMKEFRALSEDDLIKWIWKTVEEVKKSKDDENAPMLHLTILEKKSLQLSEGVHNKPAKSLMGFFTQKQGAGASFENAKKDYKELQANPSKIKDLQDKYSMQLETYLRRLATYKKKIGDVLPEGEVAEMDFALITYQNLLRKSELAVSSKSRTSNKTDKTPTSPKKNKAEAHNTKKLIKKVHNNATSAKKRKASESSASESDSENDSSGIITFRSPLKQEKPKTPSPPKRANKEQLSFLATPDVTRERSSPRMSKLTPLATPKQSETSVLASMPTVTLSSKKKKKKKEHKSETNDTSVFGEDGEMEVFTQDLSHSKKKKKKRKTGTTDDD